MNSSVRTAVFDSLKEELKIKGFLTLRVAGSCMEPLIVDNSVLQITHPESCFSGDILVYSCPYQNKLIVHRYLGRGRGQGRWKYLLMSDNAERPDILVDPKNVLGKVCQIDNQHFAISLNQRVSSSVRYICVVLKISVQKLARMFSRQ